MSDHAADVAALCDALGGFLDGPARGRALDALGRGGDLDESLRRLRKTMTGHAFEGLPRSFERTVGRLDRRTRQDGFRVLHAWNHRTHRFTDELVPVLLIDFFRQASATEPDPRTTLSIFLDYWALHLLALAAMRVWDTNDPGAALERVTGLIDTLQGEHGSGHRFVADAETLLIYALSQFHPEEQAYDRVIDRILGLPDARQIAFARVSAAVLGAHLRWGFWLMYGRDVVRMRDDNVGDYPWLLNTVHTLTRAWVASKDRGEPVEARAAVTGSLLLGLAADPWAFVGRPPPALEPFRASWQKLRGLLDDHGGALLEELEPHRPTRDGWAPLSLHFNFPHNALVAIVTLALLQGRPQPLPLNALFEEGARSGEPEAKEALSRALMDFSRGSPDRLGYRGAMLVAYDPLSAMRSFSMTVDTLRKSLG